MVDINSFKITPVQGQVDLNFTGSVVSARVKSTEPTALVAGQPVKMVDTAGGVPEVTALTANTDQPFAFVTRNFKDASFPAYASVEIGLQSTVIWMTAGAAIARGAKLEVVYTTNKVITNAGTNPVCGYAYDKAAADGDLIRVYVITPQFNAAQTIADIAGLRAALDALGDGVTQVITSLATVGAGTITAAGIAGGTTSRAGSQTGIFTDTTDTAANIVAALPNLSVNESFYYTYYNGAAYQATIAGGTGVTPSVQTVVQSGGWVRYLFTYTGTNTFTMVAVSSGAINNTYNNFINGGSKVSTAQVDVTNSTTLVTVTGCSVRLEATGKYILEGHISGTAGASGGAKVAFAGDGTLSATTFQATAKNFNGTTINALSSTTTLGTAIGAATAVVTDIDILGAIVVNAAGVLSLQIAQNASNATATSAYVNSFLKVTRVA